MKFAESDIENIMYVSDWAELETRGLVRDRPDLLIRQLRLGEAGIADLVHFRWAGCVLLVEVIELKRKKVTFEAYLQGLRYCMAIKKFLTSIENLLTHIEVGMTLIGHSIHLSDLEILILETSKYPVELATFSYNQHGVSFLEYEVKSDSHHSKLGNIDENTEINLVDALLRSMDSDGYRTRCQAGKWRMSPSVKTFNQTEA